MIYNSRAVFVAPLLLVAAWATSDHNDQRLSIPTNHGLSRSLQDSNHSNDTKSLAQGRLELSVSEAYPCIPPEEIKRIHQDSTDSSLPWGNGDSGAIQKQCYSEQNHCGFSNAPSACCRVSFEAGWLVCDSFNAFDFMPCVCNDNTFGSPTPKPTASKPPTSAPTGPPTTRAPTRAPTDTPTSSPTREPTISPTTFPTASQTISPTASPTVGPTQAPTTGFPTFKPTNAPVADPTEAPVMVTDPPTVSPTQVPTHTPTASPTQPPIDGSLERYTTENKFDADLDATIRQSQCAEDPPVIEFVEGSTLVYRYEVTRLEALTPSEAAGTFEIGSGVGGAGVSGRVGDAVSEALGSGLSDLSSDWMEAVHDELAAEFLVCDGYDFDTVWILQSKPNVVDMSTPCSGSSSNGDDGVGETPNGADSNDSSLSCVSVTAEARMIAYRSPHGKKTIKQLWSETTYDDGKVAENFAKDAITFLEDRLNGSGISEGLLTPTFEIVFVGGEIFNGKDGTTEDGGDIESSSSDGSDSSGSDSEGGDGSDPSDQGTSDTGDGDDASLWNDTTGTATGIEASNNTKSPTRGWLTPGVVATIAVVASCLLIILMLAALRRTKRDGPEPRDDEEFLQDVRSPKSDYYTGRPVDHLDLSVSSNSSVGPIVRSDLDLEENQKSKINHRGRTKKSPAAAMVSKSLSPKHFQFSGFSSGVPSPRERSRMGPLNLLADEFQEYQSDRTSLEDTTTGTHRGLGSNSSSMSSNHRGIVTNSSSMSSNLQPPYQNTSPRLYQLRDTVKL